MTLVVVASLLSLAALGHLASTDPKRRRVFHRPAPRRRRAGAAWAAALLPGAAAAAVSGAGGFFVWFGAVSVCGWALAAARPGQATELCRAVRDRIADAQVDRLDRGSRGRD
ncbi:MAG: hypothetical protein U1E40_16225 [Amaricoccus sp.]